VTDIKVDIVIIGRNEGELIRRAVDSCQVAAKIFSELGNPMARIIYVDSQSTDGSFELAKKLGAECYMVRGVPNPAAGRHLGFKHCIGEYVFFLDGDMEVYPEWLVSGIGYLEEHPDVAGAAGFVDWEVYKGDRIIKIPNHNGIKQQGQTVTTDVGGCFIYRKDMLAEVGDFDPTMVRFGEFELYLRILAGGYHIVNLTVPMAIHRDMKGSMGKSFIKQSILTKAIFIPGVVARKAPRKWASQCMLLRKFWLYLWHPISLALLLFFISNITTSIYNNLVIWGAAIIITAQLFLSHYLYKNKNILRAFVSLVTMNVYVPAFLIGFIIKYPNVGGYYNTVMNQGIE
jgi:glycosyltransferase involved in cell wall biosynthesis